MSFSNTVVKQKTGFEESFYQKRQKRKLPMPSIMSYEDDILPFFLISPDISWLSFFLLYGIVYQKRTVPIPYGTGI
jgi:hypothetical protein